jgi:hypothetical protein
MSPSKNIRSGSALSASEGDDDHFVPDFTLAERKVWRIMRLDDYLLTIPIVQTRSTGRRGKLTPATTRRIRRQRESAKKDSTAA